MFLCCQIDRQLQTYLQRVEAVLGKGWENHVEGQKLKQDGDSFRQKLNTQQLFDDWKKKVEARQLVVQGRIFNIVSQRTRTGTILKLQVNFTPETITLAKEVRLLLLSIHTLSFFLPPSLSLSLYSFSHTAFTACVCVGEEFQVAEFPCAFLHCEPSQPGQPAISSRSLSHGVHQDI